MNLGNFVHRSAGYWPDKIALIHEDRKYSYRELESRTNKLAHGLLALGLNKGDRVAIQSWNRSEIVEFEVACYKAGLVKVPVNARLALAEAIHILDDSDARVVFLGPEHIADVVKAQNDLKKIEHMVCIDQTHEDCINYEALIAEYPDIQTEIDMENDDLVCLHYTSGTSGKLKAAMQTVGNRLALIRKYMYCFEMETGRDHIMAHVCPLTHASGKMLMPIMVSGGCNLICSHFDVENYLETIQREKVTHLFLVPTMINMILNHPACRNYNISSLKKIFYGASPMSPAQIRRSMDLFGPILIQSYGAGESTGGVTFLSTRDHTEAMENNPDLLRSCGRPIFDTELKVVDEDGKEVAPGEVGEIIIRGPDVMKGYWKDTDLTEQMLKDGWLHIGDMATIDAQGFIYIVDRKKDMIISGGFNIYPTEIESVLYTHSSIFETCVVGVPDEQWGEAVKAVVVLKEDYSVSENELIEHCGSVLAKYKKPQSVDFVKSLPKNPNGKIVRRLVKESYWKGKQRRVN